MNEQPSTAAFEALKVSVNLPGSVLLNSRTYSIHSRAGNGKQGLVWRVRDEFGRDWAMKLLHPDHYADRPFLQEVSRAALLDPYAGYFAKFFDAGYAEITMPDGKELQVLAMLEEWVPGVPFADFLDTHADQVSVSFLLGFIKFMCSALSALNAVGLIHDDLHALNIMICPPLAGSLLGESTVKIVDTGSLKSNDQHTRKQYDDHQHFVSHLVSIWNVIHRQPSASARDRRFLAMLVPILNSMLDEDYEVALRDPKQIYDAFLAADARANTVDPNTLTLSSPFEFISAEHIASDELLVKLFAETCPWLQKVSGPDPCLVTGPRGCGKSTMFRWLSLKAHLTKPFKAIEHLRLSGFYVSCSTDLQNRLSWIRTDVLADRFQKEVVHYFNLVIAREMATTLLLISQRDDRTSAWGLGDAEERDIYHFFKSRLPGRFAEYLQGVPRFSQVREAIEREMLHTHSQMLQGGSVALTLPESFLGDLTDFLARRLTFFSRRRITILLDDFSIHRIPEPIQLILNRVIWERRPTHVFKLSSEKYGAKLTDSQGASIDMTREMLEIDCGREHVSLEDNELNKAAVRFAEELLDNRLKAAGYSGRVHSLIGSSKWPERSLDWALANKAPGRHEGHYHGIQTIAKLCSGDVSALLYVYRRIFEIANVSAHTTGKVDQKLQDRAIKEVSRRFLEATKHSVPFGKEMFSIANAFGNLVRNVLAHGKPQQKGRSKTRSQIPRIEIDQPKGSALDVLNPTQRTIAQELIRRAVFIEMDPGLSRHGNVTTLRWHFRRIYLPTFGAALAKNNAVKRDPEWLRYFLTDPDGACKMVWDSWPKENASNDSGGPLLEGL